MTPRFRTTAIALTGSLLCAGLALAGPDRYIESDDYRDGEEIVGVFFDDDVYSRLYESVEREDRDIELDWAWVRHSGKKPHKVKNLPFSLSDYSSILITTPENHAVELRDGVEEAVLGYFNRAFERAGLTVTNDPAAAADLRLDMAIVDLKSGQSTVGWFTIEPFIELEIRLTEAGGEELVLLRHQSHSSDPEAASGRLAGHLVRFID